MYLCLVKFSLFISVLKEPQDMDDNEDAEATEYIVEMDEQYIDKQQGIKVLVMSGAVGLGYNKTYAMKCWPIYMHDLSDAIVWTQISDIPYYP